jgi:hypothetical protein
MNENLWVVSLKDFFTKKMLGLAVIPFLFTMTVLYALFFAAADMGLDQLRESTLHIEQSQTTLQEGQLHTDEVNATYTGSGIVQFLLSHTITSWLLSFFVITVGGMFVFIIAIFAALLIIGFLTPTILKEVQRRHYRDVRLEGHGNVLSLIWHSLKYVFITALLLLVLMPLYFIPVLNIIAINIPFYYLFHKFYMLDVTSESLSLEQYRQLMFYRGNATRLSTLILYLISLVPFAALITPVFNVIVLSHTVLRNSRIASLQAAGGK